MVERAMPIKKGTQMESLSFIYEKSSLPLHHNIFGDFLCTCFDAGQVTTIVEL